MYRFFTLTLLLLISVSSTYFANNQRHFASLQSIQSLEMTNAKCWSPLEDRELEILQKLDKKISTKHTLKNDATKQIKYIKKKLSKDEDQQKILRALYASIGLVQSKIWKEYKITSRAYKNSYIEEIIIKSFNKKVNKLIEKIHEFNIEYERDYNRYLSTNEISKHLSSYEIYNEVYKKDHFLDNEKNAEVLLQQIFNITNNIQEDLNSYVHLDSTSKFIETSNDFTELIQAFIYDGYQPLDLFVLRGKLINNLYPHFSFELIHNFLPSLDYQVDDTDIKDNKFWCNLAASDQMTISSELMDIKFMDNKSIVSKAIEILIDKVKSNTKWSDYDFNSHFTSNLTRETIILNERSKIKIKKDEEERYQYLREGVYQELLETNSSYKDLLNPLGYDLYTFLNQENTLFNPRLLKSLSKISTFLNIRNDIESSKSSDIISSKFSDLPQDELNDSVAKTLFSNKTIFTFELINLLSRFENYKLESSMPNQSSTLTWESFLEKEAKKFNLPYKYNTDNSAITYNAIVGDVVVNTKFYHSEQGATDIGLRSLMLIYFAKRLGFTTHEVFEYIQKKKSNFKSAQELYNIYYFSYQSKINTQNIISELLQDDFISI